MKVTEIKICKDFSSKDKNDRRYDKSSDVLAAERLIKFLPQKAAKIVSKV